MNMQELAVEFTLWIAYNKVDLRKNLGSPWTR